MVASSTDPNRRRIIKTRNLCLTVLENEAQIVLNTLTPAGEPRKKKVEKTKIEEADYLKTPPLIY